MFGGCRRLAWSSPLSSSRGAANLLWLASTGCPRDGSARLVARYHREGEAAFEPRSRRPHTSPTRLPQSSIDLIVKLREKLTSNGLDNGPETIAWHLEHHHGLTVSTPSIIRHLRAAGLVTPAPRNGPKRPTSALPPICPTNAGKPTSPTGGSPTAPMWRSCAGSTTTPATRSPSPRTAASPAPSSSMRSAKPVLLMAFRLQH